MPGAYALVPGTVRCSCEAIRGSGVLVRAGMATRPLLDVRMQALNVKVSARVDVSAAAASTQVRQEIPRCAFATAAPGARVLRVPQDVSRPPACRRPVAANARSTSIEYDTVAYPCFSVDKDEDGKGDVDDPVGHNGWPPTLLHAAFNLHDAFKGPGAAAKYPMCVLPFVYDSLASVDQAAGAGVTRPCS